jgi:hypothetical protein
MQNFSGEFGAYQVNRWELQYKGSGVKIDQLVFESKGYSTPFDGTSKGAALPIGTYYYIINLSSGYSLLSGSLTLLR